LRWSFSLEDKDVYRLPPESQESRILALYSEDLNGRLFPVETQEGAVQLKGYLGAPVLARRSRGDQHLFINRRWVQHRLLGHAVTSAFGHLLDPGTFPFYVLFLTVPLEEVDVNVHPAKTEVKLRRESETYGFVQRAVQEALQKAGLAAMPTMQLRDGESVNPATGEIRTGDPATAQPGSVFNHSALRQGEQKPASPQAYQLMFGRPDTSQPQEDPPRPPLIRGGPRDWGQDHLPG
jgi:DNA mismatch repair ATPase MutL